jgi:hypothetical protein
MFERVVCLNLDRRSDRWEAFCQRLPPDWPFAEPIRWSAVDGQDLTMADLPTWWNQGVYHRGCYLSHLAILASVIESNCPTLILEDDACCADQFSARIGPILDALPADWEQFYLGGQFLHRARRNPRPVNAHIVWTINCNRTHAYAVTPGFAKEALAFFTHANLNLAMDHQYGRIHKTQKYKIYAARPFLLGQCADQSDTDGRIWTADRFWNDP